ncbi:MAG TPA: sulfur carrier protein ThiS [Acidimicrobiales bacterium]|nr:sulfur carrier protein ThiS [Acidimicrobiales bacterium]
MKLSVNGEERQLPEGTTVADVLEDRTRGVAVAVNLEVVPRSTWSDAVLHAGDRVEILEAHQGG